MLVVFQMTAVLSCLLLHASLSGGQDEVESLFHRGIELFNRAKELMSTDPDTSKKLYLEAAACFREIYESYGVVNGRLFYNTGNCYFLAQDIGRAILFYKKAMKLIPNDRNLRQNLSYARSKRRDKIEEEIGTRIFKILFFWHYDLSIVSKLKLFSALFGLTWLVASLNLLLRRRMNMKWLIALLSAVSFVLFISLAVESVSNATRIEGVITADEVVARKGDGLIYAKSFDQPLHSGTEFLLLEERNDWYHIELTDGRRCWIPKKSAEMGTVTISNPASD